jgi:hypothetical protein
MMDHVSPISDLVFSEDDSKLFTCALDGAIYEWAVGVSGRVREFVFKGTPGTIAS